jgi:uncharacterized repeat protein (TIGR01451 family)
LLEVTIPSIPSQSEVVVQFDNRARCPPQFFEQQPLCVGAPTGNYPITATVTATETDVLPSTSTATTNIFLYPPVIEYKVLITNFPATALPGTIADYEFEVLSTGDEPSDKLRAFVTLQGQQGTMLALTATNNPNGANASTLPNTVLQSIECSSTVLGTYPPAMVFPSTPAPWQTCPTNPLDPIPIPLPSSVTNSPPVTGFPNVNFLDNLPGVLDAPPGGGVMSFVAHVLVGDPVCVGAPDSGYRDLIFTFGVTGIPETKQPPTNPDDDTATVTTQVPGTCKVADIQFTTGGTPPSLALVSGVVSWTYTATVANLSSGLTAGVATSVLTSFEHHQFAFTETQGPLTCTSVPSGLCPPLTGGVSSTSGFSFTATIASLPPLATVTFSQQVTDTRTACWFPGTTTFINLSGNADPSPVLFDPIYSATTPPKPPDGIAGIYFGNNGQQTEVTVSGLTQCPGGGAGSPPGITINKSGPFATAADANAGTPLVGQTSGTFLPDATQVWYKVVVSNTNNTVPLLLGDVADSNFFLSPVNVTPPSGFINTGNTLADWGITCAASSVTAHCHDLASTSIVSGYNNQFTLSYDPSMHGGSAQVGLGPSDTLTYILPFTTPTHTNKCQPTISTANTVSTAFVDAVGNSETAGPSIVHQYIGMPACVPGVLTIQKVILPPATASSVPPTGLITYDVTLTNTSTTATLDIPHFVDSPNAPGVTISVLSINCTVLGGGAKCPSAAMVAGTKVPAFGSPTPLPDLFDIDYEWGVVGNNTFPPRSALKITITVQLSNPTRLFSFIYNPATFSGEHDPNGWTPVSASVVIQPPPVPALSLQKKVSPQIAAPNTLVTYTVILSNIGAAAANNAVLTDALPAALLASNPAGYLNATCTDITAQAFVPSPKGVAVCPSITSNASGLSATIATFGANTALQFTYQALMPATTVSIDNMASVTAPTVSGSLSFNAGTAQSRENVQVIAAASPSNIPTLSEGALIVLAAVLALFGIAVIRRRVAVH